MKFAVALLLSVVAAETAKTDATKTDAAAETPKGAGVGEACDSSKDKQGCDSAANLRCAIGKTVTALSDAQKKAAEAKEAERLKGVKAKALEALQAQWTKDTAAYDGLKKQYDKDVVTYANESAAKVLNDKLKPKLKKGDAAFDKCAALTMKDGGKDVTGAQGAGDCCTLKTGKEQVDVDFTKCGDAGGTAPATKTADTAVAAPGWGVTTTPANANTYSGAADVEKCNGDTIQRLTWTKAPTGAAKDGTALADQPLTDALALVTAGTVWYSKDTGKTWSTTVPTQDGAKDVTTKDGTCKAWAETTLTVKAKPTEPTKPAAKKPEALPTGWTEPKAAAPAKKELTAEEKKKAEEAAKKAAEAAKKTATDAAKKVADATKTDAKAAEVKDGPGACVVDTECDKEVGGAKVTCGAAQLAAGVLSAVAVAASL